jgi:hypothetical protein
VGGEARELAGKSWLRNAHSRVAIAMGVQKVYPAGSDSWTTVGCEEQCACACVATEGCVSFDFRGTSSSLCRMYNDVSKATGGSLWITDVPCQYSHHRWEIVGAGNRTPPPPSPSPSPPPSPSPSPSPGSDTSGTKKKKKGGGGVIIGVAVGLVVCVAVGVLFVSRRSKQGLSISAMSDNDGEDYDDDGIALVDVEGEQ